MTRVSRYVSVRSRRPTPQKTSLSYSPSASVSQIALPLPATPVAPGHVRRSLAVYFYDPNDLPAGPGHSTVWKDAA